MELTALRRWWPLAAVLGLLFLTSLAATRSAPQLDQLGPEPEPAATAPPPLLPPDPQQQPTPAGPASARAAPTGLPDWIGTAALTVLIIVGVVFAALLIWAFVRDQVRRQARRAPRPTVGAGPSQQPADELVAAVDAGLEELSDADRDPRRAVIACWVRLEQAAAAAGTPRHPGDSPTDLVTRLLAEQRVDGRLLSALRDVYREARYATHTVDDRMRAEAVAALQRLRADLGAGALR